ncbi:MAG: DUF11 domain-containing protein, partial [Methanobrevibacter sp.]|nr:DUF11 domain-containing protein [Methanobrevibacter sp.]
MIKKSRNKILGLMILIGLISLLYATQAEDNPIIINPTNSTIQAAIDNVNVHNGSTIELDNGTYTGDGNFNIIVNKSVTIKAASGANPIIEAEGQGRIFNITSNNVTLDGLNLTGASASGTGGAICNIGANVSVSNTNFINNAATFSNEVNLGGGGIYNEGGDNFIVSNSSFINNTATTTSGAGVSGGGIYNNGSANFIVSNSSFINNTAKDGGGGIYNTDGDNFIVSNSSFINNTATRDTTGDGAGIYNKDGDNFSVSNSSFINNEATSDGGGIYNDGDNFIVSNSSFINNKDGSGGIGGGIYNSGNNCIVSNSSFINNTAYISGAIHNGGDDNFTVINSSFINNTAQYGGAICDPGGNVNYIVSNSSFINNTATSYGGAICNFDDTYISVSGCDVVGNIGGGIYTSGWSANVVINYNRIVNNTDYGLKRDDGLVNVDCNWWGNNTPDTIIGDVVMNNYYLVRLTANRSTNSLSNTTSGSVLHCIPGDVTLSYDLVLNTTNTNDNVTNLPYFTGTHQVDTGVYIRSLREVFGGLNRLFNPLATDEPVNNDARINYNNTTSLNPGDNVTLNSSVDNENINITALADQEITQVNLTVNKTVDKTSVNVGDTVNYTINVSNNGSSSVPSVNVSDSLPSGLSFISTNDINYNNSTGIWNIGEITTGLTESLSIEARVNSNGSINNTATIILPLDYNNTGVNNSTVEVTGNNINLTVNKTVDKNRVYVGDTVNYTINVSNNGNLNVTDLINVSDSLPTGLSFISSNDANYSSSTGLWSIGHVGVGESRSLSIQCNVTEAGTITNNASIVLPDEYFNTGVNESAIPIVVSKYDSIVDVIVDGSAAGIDNSSLISVGGLLN